MRLTIPARLLSFAWSPSAPPPSPIPSHQFPSPSRTAPAAPVATLVGIRRVGDPSATAFVCQAGEGVGELESGAPAVARRNDAATLYML